MHPKSIGRHIIAVLMILAGFAGISLSAHAATYYIRADGGTNVQCNGTVDAPASAAPNCAWSGLMEALPPNWLQKNYPAKIAGGDTVIIAAGSYPVGWRSGYFQRWGDNCAAQYAPACHPAPIPSGTAAQPTRILGAGWDTGCKAPPELWGTQGPNAILSLDGSSHVVIACLSITDHAYCTLNYRPDPARSCKTTTTATNDNDPGKGDWAPVGLHAQDSDDVTLTDVRVHGLADQGVQAGRISNWTATRVSVVGNGNVGWNGDLGGNNRNSTNSGKLVFTDLVVAWNGCQEHYPVDGGFDLCYGQEQGGYGDGFAEAWTGGNFVFIRPQFYRNTQDGLDLLYTNGTGSVTVDRGYFARNVGNDIKTGGNATITNSVFIAQCAVFVGTSQPVAPNPCRAGGGEFADFTAPGQTITFAYNTVIGQSGCLFGGDPTGTSQTGGATLDKTNVVNIDNNIFIGQPKWSNNGDQTCLVYYGSPPPVTINYLGNIVWNVRSNECPVGSICKDPQLTNETLANFDPTPLVSSPAIGGAVKGTVVATLDYNGSPRPSQGATIGAIEYQGGSTSQTGTPAANFTYSTSGLTASFTDTSTDTGGSIGAWAWSFGDGTSSTAQSPSHAYAVAGTYPVSVTVTDKASGKTSTYSANVTVTAPQPVGGTPAANFTYSTSGLTASFTDTSTDTGGSIGAWAWSFGDGTSSTVQSPSHAYAAAGTYPVSVTVTDKASGKTSTRTAQVTVTAPQPVGGTPAANFTYTVSGLTASFVDASTDTGGTIGSWSWSFGDGTSSSVQSPSHAYAAAGTYQVSVTVTDKASGKTSTRTAQINVTAPQLVGGTPNAAFTARVSGLAANFTDASTDKGGTLDSWSWSFGDGATSSVRDPRYAYRGAGSYTVTLTVRDKASGRTSTTSRVVKIAKMNRVCFLGYCF